ncbi:PP2C family protein-serine/threonine phosphatase [Streptomyces sp. NPDC051453]|uniref:PP2C family protein-serine/threonine phosphatase n=1 Tax=Streptomyces sp. NPDC051453 TaxID=3154941 RepID=UPI003427B86F
MLDVASRYVPATAPNAAGGDWFDVIPLSGARVALVVGDVVGHGTNAAAAMGLLRTAVHTLANLDLPPDELLAQLDDLVISLIERDSPVGELEEDHQGVSTYILGATCLYAVYDPVARRCTLARAGHLPPAIVSRGTVTFPKLPAGPPLGVGFLPFESAELELGEDTLVALFTDGLVERRDLDVDVGLSRLAEALGRPAETLNDVCEHVIDNVLTATPSDDAVLLVARTHSLDASDVATWDLPGDPAIVARARELVNRQLVEWHLGELQFTTELIVSELVTNAIRLASFSFSSSVCPALRAADVDPRARECSREMTSVHGRARRP